MNILIFLPALVCAALIDELLRQRRHHLITRRTLLLRSMRYVLLLVVLPLCLIIGMGDGTESHTTPQSADQLRHVTRVELAQMHAQVLPSQD